MTTTTTARAEWVSMPEIISRHPGHWFEASTLRFFGGRLPQGGYRTADRSRVYFVSSERFECYGTSDHGYHAEPRRYTVRVMDWQTGDISDVGAFQQYASRSGADRVARREAGYR